MKKLIEVLKLAEEYLVEHRVDSARLNAERLLAEVLGVGRLELYLQYDRPLEEKELSTFRGLIRRRASGEPLQYILGQVDFRGISLKVGPGVLIPRPETEQLVGLVLSKLESTQEQIKVLDMCAGSGAVGLALAEECEVVWCVMAEKSDEACKWLRINAREYVNSLQNRVSVVRSDMFEAFGETGYFDVVVSNPPYVSTTEMNSLPAEVREHEPSMALEAGPDGLDSITSLISGAGLVLRPGGILAIETGETQQPAIARLFEGSHSEVFTMPEFHSDLTGKTRFVTANRL